MSLYESVVIARQDISTAQVNTLADELTKILKENGAKVTKYENWGLRSLAYRISKNRKGHYLLLNIDGNSEAISDYERRMRIMENVLRYMTIRVEKHEEGDSIIFSNTNKDGENPFSGSSKENNESVDSTNSSKPKEESPKISDTGASS